MIAFGAAITKPDVYRLCAEPGIRRTAEPDSKTLASPAVGSICESYNALLDAAAELPNLEALVLVHQDTELVDRDFCQKVRGALSDPDVGVVGCVGAIGVRSLAWWEGSASCASFNQRYEEHGGGDVPGFSWDWAKAPAYARTGEVDTLDGILLVLAPWAVRNVRFDESLKQLHGYDFDFCLQVRASGRKAWAADLRVIHSHPLDSVSDPEHWIAAHVQLAEKWDGQIPGVGTYPGTWRERARRAEAERDAALMLYYSRAMILDARVLELERAIAETTESISWRITRPLRWLQRPRAALLPSLRSGDRRSPAEDRAAPGSTEATRWASRMLNWVSSRRSP